MTDSGLTVSQRSAESSAFSRLPGASALVPHRVWKWLPWIVLCLGLAVTHQLWETARQNAADHAQHSFEFLAKETEALIVQRMRSHENVLRGVAALYFASSHIDRKEFNAYITRLNLKENYPGLQGIGFSLIVPAADKDRHIAAVRKEGFPAYTVKPEGMRYVYTSVVFIEPFADRNLRLFGYDMYADQGIRRRAMERARDTGRPAMSGKVILMTETETQVQAGFLMFLPVYRNDAAADTLAERRASIIGWVYAPFRIGDLMAGILGRRDSEIGLQIHDGPHVRDEALMYRDDVRGADGIRDQHLRTTRLLNLAGHEWTMSMQALPAFVARMDTKRPQLIGAGGIVTSALLAMLAWMLVSGRARALHAAYVMDAALKKQYASEKRLNEKQDTLRAIVETSLDAMVRIDAGGIVIDWNTQAEKIFGWRRHEAIGQSLQDMIIPPQYRDAHSRGLKRFLTTGKASILNSRVEITAIRRDRTEFPIELAITSIAVAGTLEFTAFIRDITLRRRAAQREQWRNHILELLAKGKELSGILEAIAEGVEKENAALRCAILLVGQDAGRLRSGAARSLPAGYAEALAQDPASQGGAVSRWRERCIVEDLGNAGAPVPCRDLAIGSGLCTYWSEPILSADDELFGILSVYQAQAGAPRPDDVSLMAAAANLASIAIEQSRVRDSLLLASLVYQNSSEAMMVADANGLIIGTNASFSKITGYAAEEVRGKNPSLLRSERHDRAFYQAMWDSLKANGMWQGEVWNRRKDGEVYPEWLTINTICSPNGAPHQYVALFSDLTEKKRSDELIWTQINFDSLTGLPNRHMCQDRLALELNRAHRTGRSLAFLIVDLDHFKHVNETLGHDVGDALIAQSAARISACCRESDTVARVGGDEFAIILSEADETCRVESVAQAILNALSECFVIGTENIYMSASIGITLSPADATDTITLLKNADQAMYIAKRGGRNRFSYFTASVQEKAQTRRLLTNDLRGALAGRQLEVHFQPIVDLASGAVVKAEALLRWRHPVRGMVSPAQFIPIAEESGLINEIGDWVFKEAAAWAQRWSARLGRTFQISVNKSPVQFLAQQKYASWPEHLSDIGSPGGCIAVEITEGLLLNAAPGVNEQLLRYRDAGIHVAIDDFGTGYSAMAYLKKFHIDYLKIDQSFVREMVSDRGDRAIVEAIIVMSHKLGFKVIAEGIETVEQQRLLMEAKCDLGQGYLFSRPVPPHDFEALLFGGPAYSCPGPACPVLAASP